MDNILKCIINGGYEHISELSALGIEAVPIAAKPGLLSHCDINFCRIGTRVFISAEQADFAPRFTEYVLLAERLGERYPADVPLNCVSIGKRLLCNPATISCDILRYAQQLGLRQIAVRQGYCACSTLVTGDNSAITADRGIHAALSADGVDVLLIQSGGIVLSGYDYGFIGGASARLPDGSVLFFGDIKTHPSFEQIDQFLRRQGVTYRCLTGALTDIGSALFIR